MKNCPLLLTALSHRLRRSAVDSAGFLWTLYLFTRNDMMTLLIPTTLYGTIAAPPGMAHHLLPRIIWIWLNLLSFDVANQTVGADEDAINEPWRPIPSQRISKSSARTLRWALVPLCFAVSYALRVPAACVVLHVVIIGYNDLGLASYRFTKILCNAFGTAAYNAGASMLMCDDPPSRASWNAQILNFLLILTTTHAQDFRDVVGDRATGRLTLPLAYPRASRLSMLVLLPAWSLFLCLTWEVPMAVSTVVCAWATYVGLQFCLNGGTSAEDNIAYRDYNIWLCLVHILVLPFIAGGASARLLLSHLS